MAVTQQEIENRLWDAADELRVAMPEAQYSSVVFPLMFWKYLSDTWDHHHLEFVADNEGLDSLSAEEAREIEYRDYQSFEIPFIYPGTVRGRRASWASILATITQPGLGQRVRASLQAIETANPDKFSRPVRVHGLDLRRGAARGGAGGGHAGDGPHPEDARGQHVP
jgi:type I restriction enzyme M protein